jgi:hypothetical protein
MRELDLASAFTTNHDASDEPSPASLKCLRRLFADGDHGFGYGLVGFCGVNNKAVILR